MTYDGPVLDNHFHLQEDGRWLDAARDFEASGGTHVTLIPIPGHDDKTTRQAWGDFFDAHAAKARTVEAETGLRCLLAVGPYPVELVRTAESMGLEQAVEAFRLGYDAAAKAVEDGKAVAIGEIGRPHFEVAPEVMEAANHLLEYGMALARDQGCPVILHTEHATPQVYQDLAAMADRAGLARDRVVKHYAGPHVRQEENQGLVPSIIASRSNIRAAIAQGDRFLMETDYIDDLSRPNVVLPPHQVPKRTKALAAQGVDEQSLLRIHKDLPERLYGVEIERKG